MDLFPSEEVDGDFSSLRDGNSSIEARFLLQICAGVKNLGGETEVLRWSLRKLSNDVAVETSIKVGDTVCFACEMMLIFEKWKVLERLEISTKIVLKSCIFK